MVEWLLGTGAVIGGLWLLSQLHELGEMKRERKERLLALAMMRLLRDRALRPLDMVGDESTRMIQEIRQEAAMALDADGAAEAFVRATAKGDWRKLNRLADRGDSEQDEA